jgi:hypothetical protein
VDRPVAACAALLLLACSQPPAPAPEAPPPSILPLVEILRPVPPPDDIPVAPTARHQSHTIDGRTLDIGLTIPAVLMVSEPGELLLSITGRDLEIEVSSMGRNSLGRPDNYRVTVMAPDGKDLPVVDAGPQFGGQTWVVPLSAERRHTQTMLLPNWAAITTPGKYVVRLESTIRARAPGGPWHDLPFKMMAPVDVVADDPARLARLIRRHGDDAVGDEHERAEAAMRHLAVMHGPDVVTEWLRIAELPAYTAKQAAARALAASSEDRALAAIVRVAATRAADLPAAGYTTEALREQSAGQLRLTAAQALSDSPHPRALDELLAMKADPDANVRLTVLHRVARIPGADALPLLDAFAADATPLVAKEAKRYLRERR